MIHFLRMKYLQSSGLIGKKTEFMGISIAFFKHNQK